MRIAHELPYLRRYARALTGTQRTGDAYAAATLEAHRRGSVVPRTLVRSARGAVPRVPSDLEQRGCTRRNARRASNARRTGIWADLTPNTREALLLKTVEEFDLGEIAQIMQLRPDEVMELLDIARREMERSVAGKVLVIEDEAIIAMDIQSIVTEMGHDVTGVAPHRDEAVRLGRANRPDLILADIQLADNSSGIDAVNDILARGGRGADRLHHRLPRAAADRRTARAGLPHRQALHGRADPLGGEPGDVLLLDRDVEGELRRGTSPFAMA